METFFMSFIGATLMIAYMLFRANRSLMQENKDYRKEARAAQAKVEQLENELEKARLIHSSPKVAAFPSSGDAVMKAKYNQLKGEFDLLHAQHDSALDTLSRIRTTVDKPEYSSSTIAIQVKTYLTSVAGLAC